MRGGVRLALLTIGASLATLATPYGLEAWFAVAHALFNPVTRIAVSDWQPMHAAMVQAWHTSPAGLVYFGCVLIMMAALGFALVRAPRAGDAPLVAFAILMLVAALVSARNMALFVIAACGPLARHGAEAGRHRSLLGGAASSERPERSAIPAWFAAGVAVALAVYTGLFSSRLLAAVPFPAGAVAFMQRQGLRGNLLCDYNWGEYLIWHTAPRCKVFIDGRYDTVYPARVIHDYLVFYFDQRGGSKVLDAYPHDFVLVPPTSGAARVTSRNVGWKAIYRDADAVLFAPVASPLAAVAPNARAPSRPVFFR